MRLTETQRVPAGLLERGPIDHICVSSSLAEDGREVAAWEGKDAEGVRLSDHSGIVVEVSVGREAILPESRLC